MYSSNPSFESIRSSRFYQSSVNPNLSSTNLYSLNAHFPNLSNSSLSSLAEPVPRRGFPISPPVSKTSTPIKEKFKINESLSNVTLLCLFWYLLSIISNYSTKLILLEFTHPTTLTQMQFLLNSGFCLCMVAVLVGSPSYASRFPPGTIPHSGSLSISNFVVPDSFVLHTTVPMGMFQFVGHLTSHSATSRIPVSLNHTIKALSPITTVLIYRVFLNRQYEPVTYLTLVPLMLGIMLSCYKGGASIGGNFELGLFFSFVSMLIFVTQNIFAKNRLTMGSNLLPHNRTNERKLDKLSILFFSLITGFIFTFPIYLILEYNNASLSLFDLTPYTLGLILVNGMSHFLQSLLAFQILGVITPISYSIANILKRIIIILVAFIIEGKRLHPHQIVGIMLTFSGLFLYDRYGLKRR